MFYLVSPQASLLVIFFLAHCFKIFFIEVQLNYNVVLASGVQQSESVIYIYIYPLFFRFFPYIGHYKVLSGVSCAIQ